MENNEKGFIVRLPLKLHQRLKVAASLTGMTMQNITINAIIRELGVFNSMVPIDKNLDGVKEYKKMHTDMSAYEEGTHLDDMNEKLEEAIFKKTELSNQPLYDVIDSPKETKLNDN